MKLRFLSVVFLVSAIGGLTGASCPGPKPTGVSVSEGDGGGVETCVTWARTQGCICPKDGGAGR